MTDEKGNGQTVSSDIRKMSFEQAMTELEGIVRQLESGTVDLEKSIEIYTRGNELRRHCESKLKGAEAKVEKIVVDSEGSISAEDADT